MKKLVMEAPIATKMKAVLYGEDDIVNAIAEIYEKNKYKDLEKANTFLTNALKNGVLKAESINVCGVNFTTKDTADENNDTEAGNEEEWVDDNEVDYTEAIRTIARSMFYCVQGLQDAGYSFEDFDDGEYYM